VITFVFQHDAWGGSLETSQQKAVELMNYVDAVKLLLHFYFIVNQQNKIDCFCFVASQQAYN